MKEKEEAKRIIELYNNAQSWRSDKGIYLTSKQFALIHGDGILNSINIFKDDIFYDTTVIYLQKVKQQIENY